MVASTMPAIIKWSFILRFSAGLRFNIRCRVWFWSRVRFWGRLYFRFVVVFFRRCRYAAGPVIPLRVGTWFTMMITAAAQSAITSQPSLFTGFHFLFGCRLRFGQPERGPD